MFVPEQDISEHSSTLWICGREDAIGNNAKQLSQSRPVSRPHARFGGFQYMEMYSARIITVNTCEKKLVSSE